MKNNKVEIIDFFRGLSIIGVVIYHLILLYMSSVPYIIKYAANVGSSGVLIFFFCSGFSLYLSQKYKPIDWKKFLKKKIINIYIPYIVVILISASIPIIEYGPNKFIAVLSNIFQFRNFSPTYFGCFGGHFWYLGTLFQLYIVFFLSCKLLDKLGDKNFTVFSVIFSCLYVLILSLLNLQDNVVFIRLFPKYYMEFAIGMVIAKRYYENKIDINKAKNISLLILGAIGLILLGISGRTAIGRLLNDLPTFISILSLFLFLYKIKLPYFIEIIKK